MAENKTEEVGFLKSKGQKLFFVVSIMLISTTVTSSSYGASIILPSMLARVDGMTYYAFFLVLGSVGPMIALPMVGALCSILSRKVVTLTGLLLQFGMRIIMMYVGNVYVLMVLWTLAAFGMGLYASAPHAIISEVSLPEERAKYFGFIATFSAAGSLVGPVLTGVLVDWNMSNLALVAYLPFAVPALISLLTIYPMRKTPGVKFDFAGLFLLVIAVCCIVFWLSLGGKSFAWFSPVGIVLLVVGVVSFIVLLRVESRKENPAFPIKIFKKKRFTAVFTSQILLVAYTSTAAGLLIGYVQQVMQASVTVSSTILMPQTIVQAVFGMIIGSFVGKNFRKNFRPAAIIGLMLYTAAMVIFYTLSPNSSIIVIYIATAMGGFGQAIGQSTFSPFFQTELSREEIGTAQSMYTFASNGGACLFGALAGAILNAGLGYNNVFLMGLIFCAASLLNVIIRFRFPKEEVAG